MFLNWINLIITGLNIASFFGAAFFFFKNNKTINWNKLIKIQIISLIIWVVEIFLLANDLSNPNFNRVLLATFMQFLSFISFWFTIFYIGKHKLLVAGSEENPLHFFSSGPFKLVRHPFYSTYLLSYLGTGISTFNLPYVILVLISILFYYRTAKDEESLFVSSDFREKYLLYRNKTGMFIPKLKQILEFRR